jgi:hypothetical protein
LAAKPLACANCRASAGRPAQIASQVALVANVIGMADGAGAVSNTDCMRFSVFHWNGQGGVAGSINQTLGLTVYCWRVQPDQIA